MVSSYYTSSLQHIRQVVPWDEPTVNPKKSARQYGRSNKQCWGSSRWLPDAYPSKYWQRNDKRRTDWSPSIYQLECGVCGVEPHKRTTRTPRADNDGRGVHVTFRIHICTAAKPRRLPTNNGKCPRTSARNWKVPTKLSTVSQIQLHVWSF